MGSVGLWTGLSLQPRILAAVLPIFSPVRNDLACAPGRMRWRWLSRGELIAGLCALGFANGLVARVRGTIEDDGLTDALVGSLGVSVLVWIAFYACVALMLRGPKEPPSRGDLTIAACALAAFVMPIDGLSWIALTVLAFYIISDSLIAPHRRPRSPAHRGAWILLATTTAMFWGHALLLVASDPILKADAILVSWLSGTPRLGNAVQLADGNGHIWIAPPCSSLANVSLAILCWVLFTQSRVLRWSANNVGWCLLSCLSVVIINVGRISLLVRRPELFDIVHGPIGQTAVSWLILVVVVAICAYGTRRGRAACAEA